MSSAVTTTTAARVVRILSDHVSGFITGITPESRFGHLGITPYDRAAIVLDIKSKLGACIPEHVFETGNTVGDAIKRVQEDLERTGRAPRTKLPKPTIHLYASPRTIKDLEAEVREKMSRGRRKTTTLSIRNAFLEVLRYRIAVERDENDPSIVNIYL